MGIKRIMGIFRLILVVSFLAFTLGCSHGGGGDDEGAGSESVSTISGVAAAGPILGGTVRVFALDANGTQGALLGETTTSGTDGSYSISIGKYTGNILVGVTGGTYKDEATGQTVQNNLLLRAAVTGVSGGEITLAVTPLTELAVQLAASLTTESINYSNNLVSSTIGVNILGVLPVDVTVEQAAKAGSAEQCSYGLMLAAISQMNVGKAEGASITGLKNDLADGMMNDTGSSVSDSLEVFVAGPNNKSGLTPELLEETTLYKAIVYVTSNQIVPVSDITELNKAKRLITDLRNTILSIYNYQGVGADGIMNTPVVNIQSEIQTELAPELTNTVTRFQEVLNAIQENLVFTSGAHLEIPILIEEETGPDLYEYKTFILTTDVASDGSTVNFTFNEDTSSGEEVGSGSISFDDPAQPTSGNLNAAFRGTSPDVQVTVNAGFTTTPGTGENTYQSLTFVGNLKVQDSSETMLEMDFSQPGRGLSATFSPIPGGNPGFAINGFTDGSYYLVNSYPTSVSFAGSVKSQTARFTVSIGVSNIVYVGGEVPIRPGAVTVTGVFEALDANGSPSGTKFTGTINGSWANAATFHFITDEEEEAGVEEIDAANWPQWTATFNGTIEAPSRPTITTSLGAVQNAWNNISLNVNFTRSNPDGSVIFISGTGAHNTTTDITTGNLSNQDSLAIAFTYDPNMDEDEELAGTIKSAGGATQATLYTVEGAPVVKFIDNYFETLF